MKKTQKHVMQRPARKSSPAAKSTSKLSREIDAGVQPIPRRQAQHAILPPSVDLQHALHILRESNCHLRLRGRLSVDLVTLVFNVVSGCGWLPLSLPCTRAAGMRRPLAFFWAFDRSFLPWTKQSSGHACVSIHRAL